MPRRLNPESILWSPANTGPLMVRNQALTIQDLSPLEHPEWFRSSFAAWYRLFLPILVRRVKVVFVPSEYVRHKRERRDTFLSLEPEFLWPTMDFVRDWLRAERKRIFTRLQWPFLATMSVTIVVAFAVWVLLASG